MVEQLPQQVELLRRKLDLLVADVHLTPACVDVQVAVLDRLVLALAALGRGATEDRADARNELARIERLRQVVVGADLESDDLVDVLVARGQHQDRHVGVLADALADLDPVDVGKHQVEHDQRRILGRGQCERLRAVRGRLDDVARVLQVERNERGDRALVLDDQDRRCGSCHRASHSYCCGRCWRCCAAAAALPVRADRAARARSCCARLPSTVNEPSSLVPAAIAVSLAAADRGERRCPCRRRSACTCPLGKRKRTSLPE